MKIISKILLIMFAMTAFDLFAEPPTHGKVRKNAEQKFEVWNQDQKSWTSIEKFWKDYVKKQGGLTWSKSKTYPEYSKVKEFDTFLVELDKGVCLMEFFHSRWRRANDVRRWDDAFNEYSACPYVFD
ncbi:MAG: hypothetical protein ACPGJI_02850 [Kangiellaceae bacterium]